MMKSYQQVQESLKDEPGSWLVTGAAGFIGSNLVETLLNLRQRVVGLDNFSTGRKSNLEDVRQSVSEERFANFAFFEGDICDAQTCKLACSGIDYVLHQAALGSVSRSLSNPGATNHNNVSGFLNILSAAKEAGVKRFVFASSSSVYGDHPGLPKVEEQIGNCLSPYAVSKRVNELYAEVFSRCYGVKCIGLRYFNVFGPRQDPDGPYAAVIPKWVDSMMRNTPVIINGDGETSRDFCYVANVVQANLLSALTPKVNAINQVYNVAAGKRATLNELCSILCQRLLPRFPHLRGFSARYEKFRQGDVRHSLADVTKARSLLGYEPTHTLEQGLDEALNWYVAKGGLASAEPIHV